MTPNPWVAQTAALEENFLTIIQYCCWWPLVLWLFLSRNGNWKLIVGEISTGNEESIVCSCYYILWDKLFCVCDAILYDAVNCMCCWHMCQRPVLNAPCLSCDSVALSSCPSTQPSSSAVHTQPSPSVPTLAGLLPIDRTPHTMHLGHVLPLDHSYAHSNCAAPSSVACSGEPLTLFRIMSDCMSTTVCSVFSHISVFTIIWARNQIHRGKCFSCVRNFCECDVMKQKSTLYSCRCTSVLLWKHDVRHWY